MNFEARKKLVDSLSEIELMFPVHEWKFAGVHFWPVLKVEILLYQFGKDKAIPNSRRRIGRIERFYRRMLMILKSVTLLVKLSLKPAKIIFSGAPSHRVEYNRQLLNRYFDPMMDYLEEKDTVTYHFEYQQLGHQNIYKSERVIDLTGLLPLFKRQVSLHREWQNFKQSPEFELFLQKIIGLSGWTERQLFFHLNNLISKIHSWSALYSYVFRKAKPKVVFGLCYYAAPMLGMNFAARRKGIKSVDMMHGTQGSLHPAYQFSRLPADGYNVLPNEFWCWDAESAADIGRWTQGSTNHKSIHSGNPWLEFLSNINNQSLVGSLPNIVYTLQPLVPVIDDYMLKTIDATKHRFTWWLRLHPRMTLKDRDNLRDLLKKQGSAGIVKVDEATEMLLPILLKAASVHISKYSGALAEAAIVGTPSIILEEVGISSFQHLIGKGIAIGLPRPTSENVIDSLLLLISKAKNFENVTKASFKQVLDEHLK